MNRSSHVLLGACAGLAYAITAPLPDVDARRWWHTLDRWLPDELLGHGGPLRHRGLTHWWGLPAIAAALIAAGQAVLPGADLTWVAWAVLAGWGSHLAGDLLWGKACPQEGRGPGIPLAPWWAHRGLGLDTGGPGETLTRWLVLAPAVVWLAGLALGMASSWPVDAVRHVAALA